MASAGTVPRRAAAVAMAVLLVGLFVALRIGQPTRRQKTGEDETKGARKEKG